MSEHTLSPSCSSLHVGCRVYFARFLNSISKVPSSIKSHCFRSSPHYPAPCGSLPYPTLHHCSCEKQEQAYHPIYGLYLRMLCHPIGHMRLAGPSSLIVVSKTLTVATCSKLRESRTQSRLPELLFQAHEPQSIKRVHQSHTHAAPIVMSPPAYGLQFVPAPCILMIVSPNEPHAS